MKKLLILGLFLSALVYGQTTVTVHGDVKANSTIFVDWTASSTGGVTYNIYRSEVQGGPYSQLAITVVCCEYKDPNVRAHTTYYYVVTAFDGSNESANSNETTAGLP
jgi:fibronectin type 3 domain-containing protein